MDPMFAWGLYARRVLLIVLAFGTFVVPQVPDSGPAECFVEFCGNDYANNSTCFCNSTILQNIFVCITNDTVSDFIYAQLFEDQYCGTHISHCAP